MRLDELVPDPDNVRIHSVRNIETIKASLIKNEQYRPLVIQKSTNRIIIGNGTFEAMTQLHEEGRWGDDAAVIVKDVDDAEARMLAITDNRSAELATWDQDGLAKQLKGLEGEDGIDLEEFGWSDDELSGLFASLGDESGDGGTGKKTGKGDSPDDFDDFDDDIDVDYQCPKCGYEWSGKPK